MMRLVTGLLVVLGLALAACGDAGTSDSAGTTAQTTTATERDGYPDEIAKPFMRTCTASAVASAAGALTRSQARQACAYALACLEERMTVAELTETMQRMQAGERNPGAKVFQRCQVDAVERVVG